MPLTPRTLGQPIGLVTAYLKEAQEKIEVDQGLRKTGRIGEWGRVDCVHDCGRMKCFQIHGTHVTSPMS